jgi:hypothetical protein
MRGRVKERVQVAEAPIQGTCRHYWVIEVANGPASRGVCKYCGAKKEFLNAFPEFNPLRKRNNPLAMPKIAKVKVAKDKKSLVSG